jgi:phage terminase large subunit-like protein
MTWMAANAVVSRRRDDTILPIKESPMSPNKIDGIDALINAIQPAVAVPAQPVRQPEYQMFFIGGRGARNRPPGSPF